MRGNHVLFNAEDNWDLSSLPEPYAILTPVSLTPEDDMASWVREENQKLPPKLNRFVAEAVIEYCRGDKSDITICKVGDGVYSGVTRVCVGTPSSAGNIPNADEYTMYAILSRNGSFSACLVKDGSNRPEQLPQFGNKNNPFNTKLIMLLALMQDDHSPFLLSVAKNSYDTTGEKPSHLLYVLSDVLFYGLRNKSCPLTIQMPGGNVDLLPWSKIEAGALTGEVLCGNPNGIVVEKSSGNALRTTVAKAKAMFAGYTSGLEWTEEERQYIPQYPDDFPVPEETMIFASRFVKSRGKRLPMNNFMWRGITAYGKSTGCEILACILNTPYVAVTCFTDMTKSDFLSQYVPNTQLAAPSDLPTFEDISLDPEGAYERITGVYKEGANCDEALKAYGEAVAARSGGARFKLVDSDFVTALTRGYVCEVQEFSRIKDPGVLVGLNDLDHPGAVIPLVDGRHERRNPNALVMYTDNVGYVSCRPVDPSVIRRMSFVIDSYEMPMEKVLNRVTYNTGFSDWSVLNQMYDIWKNVDSYCREQEITDGSVSVAELERWASVVEMEGMESMNDAFRQCVVAKATSDQDTQIELYNAMEPLLSKI